MAGRGEGRRRGQAVTQHGPRAGRILFTVTTDYEFLPDAVSVSVRVVPAPAIRPAFRFKLTLLPLSSYDVSCWSWWHLSALPLEDASIFLVGHSLYMLGQTLHS